MAKAKSATKSAKSAAPKSEPLPAAPVLESGGEAAAEPIRAVYQTRIDRLSDAASEARAAARSALSAERAAVESRRALERHASTLEKSLAVAKRGLAEFEATR